MLNERGLVDDHHVTDAGQAVGRAPGRHARASPCQALVADWSPDEDPRLNDAVARIARELAGEVPAHH